MLSWSNWRRLFVFEESIANDHIAAIGFYYVFALVTYPFALAASLLFGPIGWLVKRGQRAEPLPTVYGTVPVTRELLDDAEQGPPLNVVELFELRRAAAKDGYPVQWKVIEHIDWQAARIRELMGEGDEPVDCDEEE